MKLIITAMLTTILATGAFANGPGNAPGGNPACNASNNNASFCRGPQGDQGEQGPRGYAGKDGKDGLNGRDSNVSEYRSTLASSTALGGLHFRELKQGQVGYAVGVGGQLKGDAALAVGINFGLTNNLSANVSVSRSFKGGQTSVFVGVSGTF